LDRTQVIPTYKGPLHIFTYNFLQTDEQTDERTDGRTDRKCLSNGRNNLIILKDQTNKMYQSSREICLKQINSKHKMFNET
jgi:hypothetical protein